jgi:hypothetical protein
VAEVNTFGVNGAGGLHRVGHAGIGMDCPVWCLGVRTVGDLVGLLTEAGRLAGLHVVPTAVDGPHGHPGGRVGVGCPVGCLKLSRQTLNALRSEQRYRPGTVGDVADLLVSGRLSRVGQMGPRRIGEVRAALLLAGLPVPDIR